MVAETKPRVTLKLGEQPRYATRARSHASGNSAASGSVYTERIGSDDDERDEIDGIGDNDEDAEGESDDEDGQHAKRRTRGTATAKKKATKTPKHHDSGDDFAFDAMDEEEKPTKEFVSKSGRLVQQKASYIESSEGDDEPPPHLSKGTRGRKVTQTIESDDDGGAVISNRRSERITRQKSTGSAASQASVPSIDQKEERAKRLQKRLNQRQTHEENSFELPPEEDEDAEGDDDLDDGAEDTPPEHLRPTKRRSMQAAPEEPQGYTFRKRKEVNYAIPPPIEEMTMPPPKNRSKPKRKGPGWNISGADLSKYLNMPGADDSDSDVPGRTPRKNNHRAAGPGVAGAGGGLFASGPLPQDLAGGPSNFGKVSSSNALADADPLGVNPNINFDAVGGLDDHIASLKEMTLLPLLYPEVFQRFGVTPPRGVLFHGPPGTGKTLMARALASSCRSEGRSIAFFMRKGADCLSKWVGEAERQLRLLFEEARASQPSIIFFDEIDGLAPVRSSKQDQIHASIVSTLLALMDGMDGRGQVIVIGATNRPDAIDSALRRPGRFDREFYFPLPSLIARESILQIHTSKWEGWEKDSERGNAMRSRLAKMTKGYGGADLRMLCTEAALNSVQRTYPQIYKSTERLLLNPEKIMVRPKDFMASIKKLVPSSARSTSSTAAPIPSQLLPLLAPALEHVKSVVTKIVPANNKKRDALEEAEWEWADESNEEDGLEREMLLQSMETLRVYRPRLALCGPSGGGSGVGFIGAAVLDWLEGFHVQSLDLGTLMSDSTRTIEAAIVQLFVEAKRHQPSVVYIPSLVGWCAAVSETSRSTVKAMLETLAPTDPVLLLAIIDGPFSLIPKDVRQWFGMARDSNRVDLARFAPTLDQRQEFFAELIGNVKRKPSEFPDGWKKRRRILEILPVAPPLAPKLPSEAELAAQLENDMRTLSVLKYRLGPTLNDLKRKFKVFTKKAHEEYGFDEVTLEIPDPDPDVLLVGSTQPYIEPQVDDGVHIVADDAPIEYEASPINEQHQMQIVIDAAPQPLPTPPKSKWHNMDLEKMHAELYQDKYLSLEDFMLDISRIVHNAEQAHRMRMGDQDRLFKAQALMTAAKVHYHEFDPGFRVECERMAAREKQRRESAWLEEEERKEAEKEKEAAAIGTRRSNRANGLAPEHAITDINKIERTLKRQRSSEPSSVKDVVSEDDARSNKRSRMSEDEAAPLNQPFSAEQSSRTHVMMNGAVLVANTPPPNGTEPILPSYSAPLPPNQSNAMALSSLLNGNESPFELVGHSSLATPQPPARTSFETMDYSGFAQLPNPSGFFDRPQPIAAYPFAPSQSYIAMDPHAAQLLPLETPPLNTIVSPNDAALSSLNSAPQPIVTEPEPEGAVAIVDVPRRPSTPPPDFILQDAQLSQLEKALCNNTASLNVEQLEQLRASALDAVWRARSSWDRTVLIKDLLALVKDFIDDAALDDAEGEDFGY